MEGYDAKTEVRLAEHEFLDGAWFSQGSDVPTHVFEVQITGNAHQAIGKSQKENPVAKMKF